MTQNKSWELILELLKRENKKKETKRNVLRGKREKEFKGNKKSKNELNVKKENKGKENWRKR